MVRHGEALAESGCINYEVQSRMIIKQINTSIALTLFYFNIGRRGGRGRGRHC